MFGAEVRAFSIFNFQNDKIIRAIDVWDGRRSSAISNRSNDDTYYHDLGLDTLNKTSDPRMERIVERLNTYFASGDANDNTTIHSSRMMQFSKTLLYALELKGISRLAVTSIEPCPSFHMRKHNPSSCRWQR